MNPRAFVAVALAKSLFFVLRFFHLSGGTAAPGLWALKISPNLVGKLTKNFKTTILISGTNGKTTTARLLSSVFENAGLRPIHNRTGSNLMRGIASVLIQKVNFAGKFKEKIALFEVDEFVLSKAISETNPKIVILTNLFRDQLDRYGEIDKIRKGWKESFSKLETTSTLILNADDPTISDLGKDLSCHVLYYGIEDKKALSKIIPHTADVRTCFHCGNPLVYRGYFISHLGHYSCSKCKNTRPTPDISVQKLSLDGIKGSHIKLDVGGNSFNLDIPLPGIYNAYNVLSIVAAVKILEIEYQILTESLKNLKAIFGRFENVVFNKRKVTLVLVKNPTGTNEVLKLLVANSQNNSDKLNVLFALNDLFADGRDVSWIWDVNFEILKEKISFVAASGIRAADIGLRLKYVGIETNTIIVQNNLKLALNQSIHNTESNNNTLYILATYTAMLNLRKILPVKKFWQE